MQVEPLDFFGRTGRDFVIYADDGTERFSARRWDDDDTLQITWTDHIPRTVVRLREVQQLESDDDAFGMIVGQASDRLRDMILAGQFDPGVAERLLGRSLGGLWRVEVLPRKHSMPSTFDVAAVREEQST